MINRPLTWVTCLILLVITCGAQSTTNSQGSFAELSSQADAARVVNDVPRAIDLYSRAVQLNPQWADGWWFIGTLQYGSGAYKQASDAFSRFLALKPNAAPALALRGLCEFETADYEASLRDIEQALSSGAANDTKNEQILRYHQAMLLTRLGRFQDALKAYSFFAEHKLTSPDLLVAVGLAGLRVPLLPKELSAEQQPLLSAAGDATLKFMSGDEKSAGNAFDDLFQRFPTAENAHYLYGYLMYSFDPDSALPQFRKELEIAPKNANAMIMLSWSLIMRNKPDEALPYAKQAAAIEPQLAAAQLVFGRSLLDTGDLDAGIEHLEQGLKLEPANLEIHIALAKAYSKSGRNQDARRERTLCLELTNNSATRLANP